MQCGDKWRGLGLRYEAEDNIIDAMVNGTFVDKNTSRGPEKEEMMVGKCFGLLLHCSL